MEKTQWNSINKKQNGLEYSKMKNYPPFPSEESHPMTDPLGKDRRNRRQAYDYLIYIQQ